MIIPSVLIRKFLGLSLKYYVWKSDVTYMTGTRIPTFIDVLSVFREVHEYLPKDPIVPIGDCVPVSSGFLSRHSFE